MLPYDFDQIWEVLGDAGNINAAVKKLLKTKVSRGDPAERFIKDFRDQLLAADRQGCESFLAQRLEEYESCVFAVAAFIHRDVVNGLVNELLADYADEFNSSYESAGERINIKDPVLFHRIVREVDGRVQTTLKDGGLPPSPFMRNVVFNEIFEDAVAAEVTQILAG